MIEIIQSETFKRWLCGLRDRRAVARVNARIRRLSEGHSGDVKPVREGISEMRIDYGPGYRVYFMRRGQSCWYSWSEGTKVRRKPIWRALSKLPTIGEIES